MSQYYLAVNGQQQGPFSLADIQARGLAPDDMVWNEGMADWTPARSVADLASAIRTPRAMSVPPPSQPAAAQPRPAPGYGPSAGYAQGPAPIQHGYAAQGFQPPRQVPVNYPPQNYPPQGYAPQYPQQAYPPAGYPGGDAPQGHGYAPAQPTVHIHNHAAPAAYYVPVRSTPTKSAGVAFLLTFLFGPFGMFYSTVGGAVVMLLLTIVVGGATFGAALPILWIICMIWGCVAASNSR